METVIVINVPMTASRRRLAAALLLATSLVLASCTSGADDRAAPKPIDAAPCPTTPVDVVVSVDQWGEVVSQLGGRAPTSRRCWPVRRSTRTTTSRHRPTPPVRGRPAGRRQRRPLRRVGRQAGGRFGPRRARGRRRRGRRRRRATATNPHVWYQPSAVTAVADAVTAGLTALAPEAVDYFAERRRAFADSLGEYDRLIASIKGAARARPTPQRRACSTAWPPPSG